VAGRAFRLCAQIKDITVGNFDYRLEGRLYVIKKVPAGLCQQCGEKYLEADVAGKLNKLIEQENFTGTEEVKVIEYDESVS
jgi:YgiT-type zinc finger domain-containing protein